MVKVRRVRAGSEALLDAGSAAWAGLGAQTVALAPSPVAMAAAVSPQMAQSTGHGKVARLEARIAHNGETLSVRLAWKDPDRDDHLADLDRFADAAAIMFPLNEDANPITMGDEKNPVNAWLWRADRDAPFDVIARGYGTSERRPGSHSGLVARSDYREGGWVVVFQRPLHPAGGETARFDAGGATRIAFAVWEGSNAERAGQKAVSGAFLDLRFDP